MRHFSTLFDTFPTNTKENHMNYGMFSDTGNALIHGVVLSANKSKMDWDSVLEILYDISTLNGFEEATDTVVREAVWVKLSRG